MSVVVSLPFHNCFIDGEEAIERDEIKDVTGTRRVFTIP